MIEAGKLPITRPPILRRVKRVVALDLFGDGQISRHAYLACGHIIAHNGAVVFRYCWMCWDIEYKKRLQLRRDRKRGRA